MKSIAHQQYCKEYSNDIYLILYNVLNVKKINKNLYAMLIGRVLSTK